MIKGVTEVTETYETKHTQNNEFVAVHAHL